MFVARIFLCIIIHVSSFVCVLTDLVTTFITRLEFETMIGTNQMRENFLKFAPCGIGIREERFSVDHDWVTAPRPVGKE